MTESENKFAIARRAAGLSLEQAAAIAQVSRSTMQSREDEPEKFRLEELMRLESAFSDPAKRILREAMDEIFLA